jgi:protein O-GlcNAc transferase
MSFESSYDGTRTSRKLAYNLGLVLMQAGDLHTAQTEFLNALRLKPSYAEAHYNLALAFHLDGKEAESQAEFEKAYAINPELRNPSRP